MYLEPFELILTGPDSNLSSCKLAPSKKTGAKNPMAS